MRLPVSASSSFSPVATPADAAHAQRPFRGLCGRIYDGDTAQGKRGTGVQRSLVSMTGLPPPYTGAQASVFGTFGGHDQHTGSVPQTSCLLLACCATCQRLGSDQGHAIFSGSNSRPRDTTPSWLRHIKNWKWNQPCA